MPGAPSKAGTTSPESSASAGSELASAAARALSAALSSKLAPVSSGSGMPSALAPIVTIPKGSSSSAISASLPLLCVAMSSRSPVFSQGLGRILFKAKRPFLNRHQFANPFARETQQLQEFILFESRPFRGRLDFDDA